jgi:hypothetical protein
MVFMRDNCFAINPFPEPAASAAGSATVPVALASVALARLDQVPAIALHGGTPRRAGEACLRRRRGRQAPACPARFGVGASLRLMSAVVFPEPGLLTRRLLPQPFVAGATRGCSRFMLRRRVLGNVESFPEPALRNAGFVRQNRPACRVPPDEAGVPRARWCMAPRSAMSFGRETPQ